MKGNMNGRKQERMEQMEEEKTRSTEMPGKGKGEGRRNCLKTGTRKGDPR